MSWLTGERSKRVASLAAALFLCAPAAFRAQEAPAEARDYPRIFGSAYRDAVEFISSHPAATRAFESAGLSAAAAWAVVFPELLRWSALADLIQTSHLQSLYVQHGASYSDFSIGRFQMKPSFAESLERDFNRILRPDVRSKIRPKPFDLADTEENRRARVRRLTSLEDATLYVVIFFRVMEGLYAAETWTSIEDKICFYGAAYNSGYRSGAARIRRETGRSRFHIGLLAAGPLYNYSDIAADFFRRYPALIR